MRCKREIGVLTIMNWKQILMDFCGIGSIADLTGDNDKPIKVKSIHESQIASIMSSVLRGLSYLHDRRIVHRGTWTKLSKWYLGCSDIKSANILLNDKGEVKIADFGVASQLNNISNTMSIVGSPLYMSPEVLTHTML